ncbi:hypothetical protein [Acinetobacter baumannii]|uniref:hypothetical protein n=1 Tax=Acinetobacter baumannii TaxID=470 RepID=UPI00241784F2|nr:hypothetical protein [Acinetobacter baumannii]WFQ22510.1 hypothetical protein P9J63_05895 [Acinetobacter baumannii]WFQ26127.1 hypothetical protein P9J61_05880 [Acinetobacter baumannii]WFQ29778.1 hypothetical protein P9J59_05885 [Acinetobacter baumannii]
MLKNIIIFTCLIIGFSANAAVNDDVKASTAIGLKKIENEKNACFKSAKFSAEASGCLEEAVKRKQVLLDTLTDKRADQAKGDSKTILNIYNDQRTFKLLKDDCKKLSKLSHPSSAFYSQYQCELNVQDLYFKYL